MSIDRAEVAFVVTHSASGIDPADRLEGDVSNRSGIGARVKVSPDPPRLTVRLFDGLTNWVYSNVEPLRADEPNGRRLTTEQALAAAPEGEHGFFLVPPIVENVNP